MTVDRSHGFRRSHALVIGVTHYGDGFKPLRNASEDAAGIADCLARHGYAVTLLLDRRATRGAVLDHLAGPLASAVEADDRLTFYFAGTWSSARGSARTASA